MAKVFEIKSIVERGGVIYESGGRSYFYQTCPFCGTEVKIYVWSYKGIGKKCPHCKCTMKGSEAKRLAR